MSQPILLASDAILFCAGKDKCAVELYIQSLLQYSVWDERLIVTQNSQFDAQSTCRLFVIANNFQELRQRAEKTLVNLKRGIRREGRIGKGVFYSSNSAAKQGGIAFVFPGQGSQFPGMGSVLAKRYPTIGAWISRLDGELEDIVGEKVSKYYFEGTYASELHPKLFDLDIGACIVNALSLAYHELLTRVGIQADIYVGHSTGELTALMASNCIEGGSHSNTFAPVLRSLVQAYRSASQKNESPKGTLFSVAMLDSQKIEACFPKPSQHIYIALDNCPNQKIVFCPDELADTLRSILQKSGAMLDTLPFHYAYHTPLFSSLNQAMTTFYDGINVGVRNAVLYSCVSKSRFPNEEEGVKILLSSLLETQVNFQETVEKLCAKENIQTFIEVGPRNNVSAFMNDTLQENDAQVVSTGLTNVDEVEAFLQMLGQLFVVGKIHDIGRLYETSKGENEGIQKDVQPSMKQTPEQVAMLKVHFSLMQDFLLQQKRMMRLMQQATEQSLGYKEDKASFSPFLGELVSQDAKKASWTREVTLEKEPYLLDHDFGGIPSLIDRNKSALSVIPFTFSMEATVEAAAALAGKGSVVQSVYDVRALHWFVYLGHPLKLDIEALFIDEDLILCRIFNVIDGQKKLSFESKVKVAFNQEVHLSNSGFEPSKSISHPYHQDNFYIGESPCKPWAACQFHGPKFQAVVNITTMGVDGIVAQLKSMPKMNWFTEEENPSPLFDPILADACIQLVTYWEHSKYGVDATLLPYQIRSFKYKDVSLAVDEQITVKVHVKFVLPDGSPLPSHAAYHFYNHDDKLVAKHLISDKNHKKPPQDSAYHKLFPENLTIHSDIECFNQQGHLFVKMEGLSERHFSVPTVYNRFTDYPSWHFLSKQDNNQMRLDMFESSFLLSSGKIWLYKLAWLVFSTQEWDDWITLEEQDDLHVLYQTIICKDLVRKHLFDENKQRYAPVDLSCEQVDGIQPDNHQQTIVWLCTITSNPNSRPFKVNVKQHDTYYTAEFTED